jgi:hypothetical protein
LPLPAAGFFSGLCVARRSAPIFIVSARSGKSLGRRTTGLAGCPPIHDRDLARLLHDCRQRRP